MTTGHAYDTKQIPSLRRSCRKMPLIYAFYAHTGTPNVLVYGS